MPQIVNLHWISRWIDQPAFFASIPEDLPVVWSLHDMNPLTGGCHHALACNRFVEHCQWCPNLRRPGRRDAAWRYFRIKMRAYRRLNLHVVGNSTWTTAQATRSALMRVAKSVRTIPLGIDTEEYAPVDQQQARDALRIKPEEFAICFASAEISNRNKGLKVLGEAIRGLGAEQPLALIVFGAGKVPPFGKSVRVISLGTVSSPAVQCIAYSAADVFVMPSLVESFGLTALEAMACARPVVAFRTGGLPDLVEHGCTGLLEEEVESVDALQRALKWMRQHPDERRRMGLAGRMRVSREFTVELMAKRYADLYSGLLLP